MRKLQDPYVAIVDDDAGVRKALTRLLRACSINSRSYASPQEFLDSLATGMPECLIVDMHMPKMTGLELQGEMARAGVRIPTIVVTGHNETGYREQCKAAGATAYLLKPLDHNMLLAAINSAIGRS